MKKTALFIDEDLVEQVKAILGTTTMTGTIHAALAEVVSREARVRLFERLRERNGVDLADAAVMGEAWR